MQATYRTKCAYVEPKGDEGKTLPPGFKRTMGISAARSSGVTAPPFGSGKYCLPHQTMPILRNCRYGMLDASTRGI